MNITRHNYEEYFILYLDNELSSEERRQVELFAGQHPDLKTELESLLQTKLVPEADMVFQGKDTLFKTQADLITKENCGEWLLLYIDNELASPQRAAAEQLIATDAAIKAELQLLNKTRLQPDEGIKFSNKEVLYRKEERVRVISIQWRRIAVAAVLLVTLSTAVFLAVNNNDASQAQLANQPGKGQLPGNNTEREAGNGGTGTATLPPIQEVTQHPVEKNTAIVKNETAVKEAGKLAKGNNRETNGLKRVHDSKSELAATDTKEAVNRNNLPLPTHNPNVNRDVVKENAINVVELPRKVELTIPKENKDFAAVTTDRIQPLDYTRTAEYNESADRLDANQQGKKNKLRGFFRKVARTIEKRTNIKATDDEDRLLLAGFAVKL